MDILPKFDIFVICTEFCQTFCWFFETDIIVTFLLTTIRCCWQMLLPVGCWWLMLLAIVADVKATLFVYVNPQFLVFVADVIVTLLG